MNDRTVPQPLSLDEAFAIGRVPPRVLLVIVLCLVATATEGYDFQSMSLAAPLLARAWRLSPGGIGLLLTTSVAGVVAGSLFLAPYGDRYGRRPCALAGLLIAVIFTTACAFAPNMDVLLLTRALAGLGIGLATPNLNVIAMETSPLRWRTLSIVLVSCGYPLGSTVGAMVASAFVETYGYKPIFLLAGAATATILLALVVGLPESPYFLAKSPAHREKMHRLMRALTGQVQVAVTEDFQDKPKLKSNIAALLTSDRRMTTLLLWLLNFMGFAMLYFFVSWLPSLLANRGLSPAATLRAVGLFNAGGFVGAILLALLLRRLRATFVLSLAYLVAAAAVVILALLAHADGQFLLAVGLAGGAIIGSQFCLTAVVNQFYPADIRVSAGGYAAGAGRLGAVLAPMAGALALSRFKSSAQVFLITVVPSLIALAIVLWMGIAKSLEQPDSSDPA